MIEYKNGDFLTSKAKILAHGVNCSGAFGSGVAGQISKKYPFVREMYFNKYNSFKPWKLGEVQIVDIGGQLIANCATQQNFGSEPGVIYCSYEAIEKCLRELLALAIEFDIRDIAIPKIGCGLAGGDWNVVEKICKDVFLNSEVLLEIWSYP